MTFVERLILGGWTTTFLMVGFCALRESGKGIEIRRRIAAWRETVSNALMTNPAESQDGKERAF